MISVELNFSLQQIYLIFNEKIITNFTILHFQPIHQQRSIVNFKIRLEFFFFKQNKF